MKLNDITLALRAAMDRVFDRNAEDVTTIIDEYAEDFTKVEERLVKLVRQHAGLIPTGRGDSPHTRLNSLRLETRYPGVRKAALAKLRLDNETKIAELAGPLLTAVIKREFAIDELRAEDDRTKAVKKAQSEHKKLSLYVDVAVAADRLFEIHGITYHVWKALSDDQLNAIAQILRDPEAISPSSAEGPSPPLTPDEGAGQ